MSFFIGGIGGVIGVVGFVGLLSPGFILRSVEGLKPSRRLYALSVARLTIGLVLFLGAQSTAFPGLFRILGVLVILRGLAIPILGPSKVRAFIDWLQGRPPVIVRLLLVPATALGGLLVWAAFQ